MVAAGKERPTFRMRHLPLLLVVTTLSSWGLLVITEGFSEWITGWLNGGGAAGGARVPGGRGRIFHGVRVAVCNGAAFVIGLWLAPRIAAWLGGGREPSS